MMSFPCRRHMYCGYGSLMVGVWYVAFSALIAVRERFYGCTQDRSRGEARVHSSRLSVGFLVDQDIPAILPGNSRHRLRLSGSECTNAIEMVIMHRMRALSHRLPSYVQRDDHLDQQGQNTQASVLDLHSLSSAESRRSSRTRREPGRVICIMCLSCACKL
jgi:hypothetical protein